MRATWKGRRVYQVARPTYDPSKHAESRSGDTAVCEPPRQAETTENNITNPLRHKDLGGDDDILETTPKKMGKAVLDSQLSEA